MLFWYFREDRSNIKRDLIFSLMNLHKSLMSQKVQYWLMKSEPNSYSITDLKRDKTAFWDGVRNYQARNFMMKDMKKGDKVLFYHSSSNPPGVVGLAVICKEAEADQTALDESSQYYDPKATKENPIWFAVTVQFVPGF